MIRTLDFLALLVSAAAVHVQHLRRGAVAHDTGRLQTEYPFYHTTEELQKEAKRLASSCKAFATFHTVQKEYVGIDEIRVKAPGPKPINRVSLLFGEHSRELIGPETGLMLLKMLCGARTAENSTVEEALKHSEFQLILNANPASRRRVEAGEYCVRENPNGVDLNRNWDEKWFLGSEDSADQSHGKSPFSEPETQVVRDLIEDFSPTTFLSVHSGTLGLYMPWAYDREHLAKRNRAAMLSVLQEPWAMFLPVSLNFGIRQSQQMDANRASPLCKLSVAKSGSMERYGKCTFQELDEAHCKCPFGAAGKEVGYDCPGTSFDWVFDHLKAPFSFAWEIYANPSDGATLRKRWEETNTTILREQTSLLQSSAWSDLYAGMHSDYSDSDDSDFWSSNGVAEACFSNFNPGTEEDYNATVTNWATSYLNLAIETAAHLRHAEA